MDHPNVPATSAPPKHDRVFSPFFQLIHSLLLATQTQLQVHPISHPHTRYKVPSITSTTQPTTLQVYIMSALVVPIQPLGVPAFGDYHHHEEEENGTQQQEEPETNAIGASQSQSGERVSEDSTLPANNLNLSAHEEESSSGDVQVSFNTNSSLATLQQSEAANGVPRARYALEDEEDEAVLAEHMENDAESTESRDEGSIPPLHDMVDTANDPPPMITEDNDESDDQTTEEPNTATFPPQPSLPFGGLHNLGNTCYLNSAMQMVASLDNFAAQIREHIPEMEQEETSTLREALLEVLDSLQKGETLQPDAFKNKIDERSPLFIGYRQQDSHEFLTALLNLLDEDYKKTPPASNEESSEDSNQLEESTQNMDTSENNVISSDEDPNPVESEDDEGMDAEEASPVKKQKVDSEADSEETGTLTTSRSFMDLNFADIENLLHGDGESATATSTAIAGNKDGEVPRCKLVGGRMTTSGVNLTRYDEGSDVTSSTDAVKSSLDEEQTSGPQEEEEQRPYSPVEDYFTTQVRVCLTCDSCKYRRSHDEMYLHLSLEIGPNIGSIEEGLRTFFKPERREIKCEKCFCETALQTTEITKLPRALLFHLKRFIVDVSPDYTSISYRKDQSEVSFEPELELNEHGGVLGEVLADEVAIPYGMCYGIRSVVNHIGSSASCGHYTADARKVFNDEGHREWVRFNDSYVSKVTMEEAVDQAISTAYMVLYELEKAPSTIC